MSDIEFEEESICSKCGQEIGKREESDNIEYKSGDSWL